MEDIKIMQVNMCGLSSRSTKCLENYIHKEKADIVLISETKVKELPDI